MNDHVLRRRLVAARAAVPPPSDAERKAPYKRARPVVTSGAAAPLLLTVLCPDGFFQSSAGRIGALQDVSGVASETGLPGHEPAW